MTTIVVQAPHGRKHWATSNSTTIDGRTMSVALVFDRTMCGQEIPFGRGWFEPEKTDDVDCSRCVRAAAQQRGVESMQPQRA